MGSNQIALPPLLFFHGFFGKSSDWNFLKNHQFLKPFQAISYTEDVMLGPENFLSDWGQNFLAWKQEKWGSQKIKAVGYSQGGRLLLQAFSIAPEQFEKLVLISTHPGLKNFAEKEQRLLQDRNWAQQFRKTDWRQLQDLWNAQGVFKDQPAPMKLEEDFNRETLALCLENWSLAHQQNFCEIINHHHENISIVIGEDDQKYVDIYQNFLKGFDRLKIEKGAAHRVPFDQPASLSRLLNQLLS